MQINRRSFLMGSAGVATGLAVGAGSAIPAFAEDAQLRAMWWGSNDRAKRTLEVAKLYQTKTPGVTIVGESLERRRLLDEARDADGWSRDRRCVPARAQHDLRLLKARRLHAPR